MRRKDWTEPMPPVCVQGGRRKLTYRTKAEAKRFMRSGVLDLREWTLRVYRCSDCGYYHLTSKPRRG